MSLYFYKITDPILIEVYFFLCLLSFSICCFIIVFARYFFSRRSILDEAAVQRAHNGFVPRVGGISIYLSILIYLGLSQIKVIPLTILPNLDVGSLFWLVLSALPVFVIGLVEDLGYFMSSKKRLYAATFSAFCVLLIFEVWVSRIGLTGFDKILSFAPLGIIFTIFATIGVVNGFNLIDGLNGLTAYVSISSAAALSVIAFEINQHEIMRFLFLFSAAVMGFLILNFPFGKIFLGDAGAYMLGHLLVWLAIILVNSNPEISPFAILLIFFWPVADTLLAIWRRWTLGDPSDRPDRLHFHHLAMRLLEIRFLGRGRRNLTNPLATIILIPLISVPQILATLYWNNLTVTFWATILFGGVFSLTYFIGINWSKKGHIKKL